jgi:hypothetical protein
LKNLTEIPAFCQHLNLKKKILFSTKNSDNRLFKYAHSSVSCLLHIFSENFESKGLKKLIMQNKYMTEALLQIDT